ncbi:MAG: hypothetical protein WCA10_13300, partial [Terracidiphilus sp.]
FVQHHLTESGHTDLLVTQKLSQPTNYSTATEVAAAAQRLSSNRPAFTDFQRRTFHMDGKSPSRTIAPETSAVSIVREKLRKAFEEEKGL